MEHGEIVMLLIQYKYLILCPLLLIQGPVVAVIAGFLSGGGYFTLPLLISLVIIADLITDTIVYSLGRWGRDTIISRFGKYIGLTSERLKYAEKFTHKYGVHALVVGKVAYSLGAPTMALAGIGKMPYLKFILINFLISIPKSILLVLLGYYIGENTDSILHFLDYIGFTILIIVVLAISFFYIRKKKLNLF